VKILWGDTETYSACDLKAHGTHRYAADPSTEITVWQWAVDDGQPVVEDLTGRKKPSAESLALLNDPDVLLVFHNVAFDRTLLRHCWGMDIPVERWYDTMIQAMSHGLPGGLDKIGAILKLNPDEAKDKRGRELIQLFCKPRPKTSTIARATRETHPHEWREFLEYRRQDIVAMRAISTKLPRWNYRPGDAEHKLWHLDQHINDRGFCVDTELADAATRAVAVEQKRLKSEIADQTDGLVQNASKRDQLLAYILAEHGVDLPDMKADTLRRRLEDPELPAAVKLLISIRLEATKTSTAKYGALIKATSEDGRLRNTLQFAGAQRTARWAGRIFQPQNLPRYLQEAIAAYHNIGVKDLKEHHVLSYIEDGIVALKGDFADLVFPDVMALTSNTIRSCIVAPPGKKLVVADLSNIEGRGLAYLAGETWKLQAFAAYDAGEGPDLYVANYARSFGVDHSAVGKPQRQIGKVQELALGYEGGVAAFLTFAAVYNMDLDDLADAVWSSATREALKNGADILEWVKRKKRSTYGLSDKVYIACEVLKRAWRDAHPNTEALWKAAGDSVRAAIQNPGQTFPIGEHLKARVDGTWLRIRLPSGRYLCYIDPKVDDHGQISYAGVNQYTRQWGRIKTYGGKLVENATQAFARDIMAHNMGPIDAVGYEIVLSVHDELITEAPQMEEYSVEHLAKLLATVPPWAKGIPLAAAGFECTRYRKE
jgi:DNA polymerase